MFWGFLLVAALACVCHAKPPKEAFQALSAAAAKGDPKAMWKLGDAYWDGKGTKVDVRAAFRWWRAAAETGDPGFQREFAWKWDRFGLEEDPDSRKKEALRWLGKAGEAGDVESMVDLGRAYLNGNGVPRDAQKGLMWLTKAADKNDPEAGNIIGVMYKNGDGVPADLEKAAAYFEKAAAGGNEYAQVSVARLLLTGSGVPRDPVKAVSWLLKAADAGNPRAQWELANCFQSGTGVSSNPAEAVKWLGKASDAGQINARFALAKCLLQGKYLPKDLARACALLKSVAEELPGDGRNPGPTARAAKELLDKVEKSLSPGQLTEAEKILRSLSDCQPDSLD